MMTRPDIFPAPMLIRDVLQGPLTLRRRLLQSALVNMMLAATATISLPTPTTPPAPQ